MKLHRRGLARKMFVPAAALAAATLAIAVFALFWLTSSTASASYGGDVTQTTPEQTAPELPDSDNLDFTGTGGQDYGASSFGIQYCTGSYSKGGVAACTGSSVFDGFAQTSAMSG